jgi:hypothetical protein
LLHEPFIGVGEAEHPSVDVVAGFGDEQSESATVAPVEDLHVTV